jgi:addiction module HigA family antidote
MKLQSKTTTKGKVAIGSSARQPTVVRKPALKRGSAVSVNRVKASSSRRSASKLPPIPPGKILKERLMAPNGLTANKLAKLLGVSPTCVTEIIKGKREITTNTAARLGRYFGMSAEFWLNLQMRYELEKAEDSDLFLRINETVPVLRLAKA